MNIPNDTGHPWRLDKYIEYNKKVPPVDVATYMYWCKKLQFDPDMCIMMAWYHSLTYCELSAILLFQELPYKFIKKKDIRKFWLDYKGRLKFNSARIYVSNLDWFVPSMDNFMSEIKREPYAWLKSIIGDNGTPKQNYEVLFKHINKWKYMGRFSTELFLEAITHMANAGLLEDVLLESPDFDWKNGSNVTSGLLTLFYKDKLADKYEDNKHMTPRIRDFLDVKLVELQEAIHEQYPEDDLNISVITPKLCSFRNLFKGSRYGGFHHDRQLEQLIKYEQTCPEHAKIWRNVYKLRKNVHDPSLLGEIGGWSGIRTKRKKLFIEEGLTGVENVSKY